MRSFIGSPRAWNKTQDNPYIMYAMGVKEEGGQIPAVFKSKDLAMNALMQTLVDLILENKDKDIVWRGYPEVDSYETKCPVTGEITTWYKATARLCFEDE